MRIAQQGARIAIVCFALVLIFAAAAPGRTSAVALRAQAANAEGRAKPVAGFVLLVKGTWHIEAAKRPVEVGMALPPGAVLQLATGPAGQSEVRVALPHGRELSSCSLSAAGDRRCGDRLELPAGPDTVTAMSDRIQLALSRAFSTGPKRLVTTISRGILSTETLQSAPLKIEQGRIDLSGLFVRAPTRECALKFSSLPDASVVFECRVRGVEDYSCRPVMLAGTEPAAGALFQVTSADFGWTGGALLVSPRSFDAVNREFGRLLDSVSAWDANPPRIKRAREVVLELLVDQRPEAQP